MEFADRLLEQVMKYPVQLELDEVLSLEKKKIFLRSKLLSAAPSKAKAL